MSTQVHETEVLTADRQTDRDKKSRKLCIKKRHKIKHYDDELSDTNATLVVK